LVTTQFTEESPHFQASGPVTIGTEGPFKQKIVRFPPKTLALARSHPPESTAGELSASAVPDLDALPG
jgi:hypothetical protein